MNLDPATIAELQKRGAVIGPSMEDRLRPPEPVDDKQAEKDLDAALVKEAKAQGWLTYHTRNSLKSEAGFPDRVLVRGNRVIFAELKSATGKLSAVQLTWREVLEAVGGNVEYRLWRPVDWLLIVETLAQPASLARAMK